MFFWRDKIFLLFIIFLFLSQDIFAKGQELSQVVGIQEQITNSSADENQTEIPQEESETLSEMISNDYSTALDGEVQIMIDEYIDIVRLYQKPPANVSDKVRLYQRLLERLNKMIVNTSFLADQRDLLKNTIRFQLGIRDKADECLKKIIKNTRFDSVRDDALSGLVSFNYNNGEVYRLKTLLNSHTNYLSSTQLSNIDVFVRSSKKEIDLDEADSLLSVVLSPVGMYQHAGYKLKLLNNIQDLVSSEGFDKAINLSFYNNDLVTAVSLIRVQIKNSSVDYYTLHKWGNQLGVYQKDLVDILTMYQRRSEDYKRYVSEYQKNKADNARGRTYHRRLFANRGEANAPYNVSATQYILDEYLKGGVEPEYLEENAKRAFRNFLAFKRYDVLLDYSMQMREKLGDNISPYINFWGSYALLKEGMTNEAIPLLGEILMEAPESYCGIVALKKLQTIFKSSTFSQKSYMDSIKQKSTNDKKSLLDYAYVSYYLGSRSERGNAEKIFAEEGILYPPTKAKLSKDSQNLLGIYTQLNLTKNIRYFIYHQGFTNVYDQDTVLFESYQQRDNLTGIMEVIASGHKNLGRKNISSISAKTAQAYYPRPYQEEIDFTLKKSNIPMDIYLLYSVMRTESFYKEKAISRAGARGLMQIMPATGSWLVGKYFPELQKYDLYEPSINIYLGSVYLYDNIDKVGMLPALAAYNSGPTFVNNLIKKYQPHTDLELVEIHPKKETREYVKKVIESYERYSKVYGNKVVDFLQS